MSELYTKLSFTAFPTQDVMERVWNDSQMGYWSWGLESVGGVREHAAGQPRSWSCARLKSRGGDVTTKMRSLWWLGEDRSPLTFDSGSLGSTQHWTPLGSFNTPIRTHAQARSHTHFYHPGIHMSHMLTHSGIPCKSAFINVTFVSQTKKQTSKLS